jgi:hypothetical protein
VDNAEREYQSCGKRSARRQDVHDVLPRVGKTGGTARVCDSANGRATERLAQIRGIGFHSDTVRSSPSADGIRAENDVFTNAGASSADTEMNGAVHRARIVLERCIQMAKSDS